MLDNLFNNQLLRFFLYIGYYLNLFLDKGILYIFGPMGIYKSFNILSYKSISLSSNNYSLIDNNYNQFNDKNEIKHFNFYLFLLFLNIILFILVYILFNINIITLSILFFIFIISIPFIF